MYHEKMPLSASLTQNESILRLKCVPHPLKLQTSMFLIHTMTGVSMWCWMVASGLRYLAVYHPFLHMRRWKLGQRAILANVVISAAMNFWLLFAVDASETRLIITFVLPTLSRLKCYPDQTLFEPALANNTSVVSDMGVGCMVWGAATPKDLHSFKRDLHSCRRKRVGCNRSGHGAWGAYLPWGRSPGSPIAGRKFLGLQNVSCGLDSLN